MPRTVVELIVPAAFLLFKSGYRLARSLSGAGRFPAASDPAEGSGELDLTGRVVTKPMILETAADEDRQILFAYYDSSLAHSFWRAQELSLFKRASASF